MPGLPSWFTDMLGSIERSGLGEAIRTTPYLYPVLMSIHVLGIALLIGPAFAVDLRLLGVGRKALPVTVVAKYLLPISHVGFGIVAVTGVGMFTAIALAVGGSAAAPWKFGLIALAGLNILVFHKGVYRTVENWDIDTNPPLPAKIAATISATAWTGVVFGGRFLAY